MITRPQHIAHGSAPVLQTARLTLRMPSFDDFAHQLAFYASPRSVWEGGPFSLATADEFYAKIPLGPFARRDHFLKSTSEARYDL